MFASKDYFEMARDVLREAEKTKDQNRKKALLDIAKRAR
jgi:hypothetical protein